MGYGKWKANGAIDTEPDWKHIGEQIIAEGNTDRYADEIRQMAQISSTVRRAQKSGCTWLNVKTGKCKKGKGV